jgi:hypothetical protein
MTLYQPGPYRRLLKRSRIAEGQRAEWGSVVCPEPYWAYSHWAVRCPRCRETSVHRMVGEDGEQDFTEIFYAPPREEPQPATAEQETLF